MTKKSLLFNVPVSCFLPCLLSVPHFVAFFSILNFPMLTVYTEITEMIPYLLNTENHIFVCLSTSRLCFSVCDQNLGVELTCKSTLFIPIYFSKHVF